MGAQLFPKGFTGPAGTPGAPGEPGERGEPGAPGGSDSATAHWVVYGPETSVAVSEVFKPLMQRNPLTGWYHVKHFGAYGDNITDDTDAIQAALTAAGAAGGGTVYVEPGNYKIRAHAPGFAGPNYLGDEGGVSIPTNVHLMLDAKATLWAIPNTEKAYVIVRVYNKGNVTISGGTINGDRSYRPGGSLGEWGYGIAVTGGYNITIRDVTIQDCWGDGINVQRLPGAAPYLSRVGRELYIENTICSGNRRQGMSLEGIIGAVITNCRFINNGLGPTGTLPGAGVDIEPSTSDVPTWNIMFRGCTFGGNKNCGLLIMGNSAKDITVDGCRFDGNTDSEAQFKTYAAGSVGIQVLNSSFGPEGRAIRFGGGSGHSAVNNIITGTIGFTLTKGPDTAVKNVLIQGNRWVPSGSFYYALLATDVKGATIADNVFDASALTDSNGRLDFGAGCEQISLVRNRLLNVARGFTLNGATHVLVEGNDVDNSSIQVMGVTSSSAVKIRNNTFAGPCHGNNGVGAVTLDAASWWVELVGNSLYKEPRVSGTAGLGAGRAARLVQWTSGQGDLVMRFNRLVGSGLSLIHSSYIAASGYVGGENGLQYGPSTHRPTAPVAGTQYFDSSLNKMIAYSGAAWHDGAGTPS